MFTTRPELRGTFGMVASTHWLASPDRDGGARARRQRVRRRGRDRVRPPGRRAAPERAGRRGAGRLLVRGPRRSRSSLCGQGVAPPRRRSSASASSGTMLVPAPAFSPRASRGAFGGWLLLLRDFGTWRLGDVLEFAIGYAEHGYPAPRAHPRDDRGLERGARRELARLARALPAGPGGGRALPQPRARGDVPAHRRREPRRLARGGDREGAGGVVRGLRRGGDRPLLRGRGRPPDRERTWPGGEATLRAARDARVPRPHRLQDPAVGSRACRSPAARAPRRASTSPSSPPASSSTSSSSAGSSRSPTATPSTATRPTSARDAALARVQRRAPRARRRRRLGRVRSRAGAPPEPARVEATVGSGEPAAAPCHLDVADRFGNMVSATPSGGWLQSSPVIPALGWPLGTRAQMFWLEEGLPSSLEPGRGRARR